MTLLEATDLVIGYLGDQVGEKKIVANITLSIKNAEIVGLTGVSGSGKSTLIRVLAGSIAPLAGKISWQKEVLQTTSYSPQDEILLDYRTVWENAVLLLESPRIDRRELKKCLAFVAMALERANLTRERDSFPSQLSGGMRQRLQVIQALALPSKIALLDEPFSEQDRDSQYAMEDLMWGTLRRDLRASVVVSHDVDALTAVCDRVIFLGGSRTSAVAEIKTPQSMIDVGGTARRSRPEFIDFSAALWRERAKAAIL